MGEYMILGFILSYIFIFIMLSIAKITGMIDFGWVFVYLYSLCVPLLTMSLVWLDAI